jgi:hypothetical protein
MPNAVSPNATTVPEIRLQKLAMAKPMVNAKVRSTCSAESRPPPHRDRSAACAAQEAVEVAFVEDVSGQVVAFSQGKPTLLSPLDTINHRTQLDLPPNSEVRVCHYQAGKIVSLKGVTNCAMWSHFIVLGTPLFNLFAGIVQIQEPMPAEALQPNRGVEAFYVGIVGGLAWAADTFP